MDQQREAFFEHNINNLPLKDMEQLLSKYKGNTQAQFPAIKYIYEKKFAFLSMPLTLMQQKEVFRKKPAPTSLPTTIKGKIEPIKPKEEERKRQKTKFGVILEEEIESESEIKIPDEIRETIISALKGKLTLAQTYDEALITELENLPFSEKEPSGNTKWIDSLLQESHNQKHASGTIIPSVAKGPIISEIASPKNTTNVFRNH